MAAAFCTTARLRSQARLALDMEVIRHAELIVEWFLWTIEHTNRSLDNSNATFRPSRASPGIQSINQSINQQVCMYTLYCQAYKYVCIHTCMPDEARDGRNVAFEIIAVIVL